MAVHEYLPVTNLGEHVLQRAQPKKTKSTNTVDFLPTVPDGTVYHTNVTMSSKRELNICIAQPYYLPRYCNLNKLYTA